jgi:hypothetical protein
LLPLAGLWEQHPSLQATLLLLAVVVATLAAAALGVF